MSPKRVTKFDELEYRQKPGYTRGISPAKLTTRRRSGGRYLEFLSSLRISAHSEKFRAELNALNTFGTIH